MINGNYKMFVDDLYQGQELNFLYNDRKYFIQGFYENGTYSLTLTRFVPLLEQYLWHNSSNDTMYENAKEFMKSKVFDGKTFAEIESEVEWLDFTPLDIEKETKEYWEKHPNEIPDGIV